MGHPWYWLGFMYRPPAATHRNSISLLIILIGFLPVVLARPVFRGAPAIPVDLGADVVSEADSCAQHQSKRHPRSSVVAFCLHH